MLSFEAALVSAIVLTPLMLLAAYLDLRFLRLPNWLALVVLALFVLIAVPDLLLNDESGMTWGLFGWRLVYAAVVLVVGFLLFSFGLVGGGDVKLLAALVPFIAPADVNVVLLVYCAAALLGVLGVWLLSRAGLGERTGWATWASRNEKGRLNFPWGVALSATMIVYLVLRLMAYSPLDGAPA